MRHPRTADMHTNKERKNMKPYPIAMSNAALHTPESEKISRQKSPGSSNAASSQNPLKIGKASKADNDLETAQSPLYEKIHKPEEEKKEEQATEPVKAPYTNKKKFQVWDKQVLNKTLLRLLARIEAKASYLKTQTLQKMQQKHKGVILDIKNTDSDKERKTTK